ncbi:MAG TPA: DinB family protein [Candidatus Angelobacter sp.]|nr:DinB family protein [Candidatus Angelobacter sp.]
MRHVRTTFLLLVLCLAVGALAYGQAQGSAAAPAGQAKPAPTLASIVENQLSTVEKEVVEAAEAMPEEKFNFSPENLKIEGSDYKGVRTFAVEARHIATANYFFWSAITGDKLPEGIKDGNGPEALKSKAEIVKFLKDSFVLGHKAVATLTTDNLLEPLGQRKTPRIQLATSPIAHAFDHYGQMVEYLRMNGIVPPASRH